jgi:hypothetical protein
VGSIEVKRHRLVAVEQYTKVEVRIIAVVDYNLAYILAIRITMVIRIEVAKDRQAFEV